ncbi:MAG TPA: DUF3592 domain-containing protein [Pyrinomonadaceae bacterium]|nr:DUF3592 domain-containing protein [Pyrinomonadaceae bacterium]
MLTNVEDSHRRRILRPLTEVIGLAALLLVAATFLIAAGSRWRAAQASRSWPGTEGVIIESRLTSNCSYCRPLVNYRYVVNGQSFVGEQLVAGPQDYYRATEAEAKVAYYAVGRRVTVFYDLANPSASALEPGVLRGTVYLFSLISLSALGSTMFLFWRARR